MAEATSNLSVKNETVPAAGTAVPAWSPFDSLRREIDRVFENMGVSPLSLELPRPAFDLSWPRDVAADLVPAVDIAETKDAYEITAELPGMSQKDVDVKLVNGTLVIRGEKKSEKTSEEQGRYLSERQYGVFSRTFRLPDGIDTGKIAAQVANGVLKVTLPKSVEAQQSEKQIEVKAA